MKDRFGIQASMNTCTSISVGKDTAGRSPFFERSVSIPFVALCIST